MRSETGPEFSPARIIGAQRNQFPAPGVKEGFHFFQLCLEEASELFVLLLRQTGLDHTPGIRRQKLLFVNPILVKLLRLTIRKRPIGVERGIEIYMLCDVGSENGSYLWTRRV